MNKIKIAIIGCGIITKEAHLPAIKRLGDRLDVIAVCNRSKKKAIDIAEELKLPESAVWTDWKKMITEVKELDAVLIALPITMNYPVSKACCEAGLSVICEKPAGMNSAEAIDSGKLASKYGVTYMTAENFHFEPRFNKAAELVEKGVIGKLHSTSWNIFAYMDKNNKYNKTQWRAHNEYDGGYVLDGGVHFVHALQMIAGPVTSVFAHTASVDKDLGTMDTAMSLLKHENGVVSSMNMGWRSASSDEYLKVYGDKGSLIIKDDVIIQLTETAKTIEHTFEKEDSFFLQWDDFLKALKNRKCPSMAPGLPVDDVRIVMAVIESGRTGSSIKLH